MEQKKNFSPSESVAGLKIQKLLRGNMRNYLILASIILTLIGICIIGIVFAINRRHSQEANLEAYENEYALQNKDESKDSLNEDMVYQLEEVQGYLTELKSNLDESNMTLSTLYNNSLERESSTDNQFSESVYALSDRLNTIDSQIKSTESKLTELISSLEKQEIIENNLLSEKISSTFSEIMSEITIIKSEMNESINALRTLITEVKDKQASNHSELLKELDELEKEIDDTEVLNCLADLRALLKSSNQDQKSIGTAILNLQNEFKNSNISTNKKLDQLLSQNQYDISENLSLVERNLTKVTENAVTNLENDMHSLYSSYVTELKDISNETNGLIDSLDYKLNQKIDTQLAILSGEITSILSRIDADVMGLNTTLAAVGKLTDDGNGYVRASYNLTKPSVEDNSSSEEISELVKNMSDRIEEMNSRLNKLCSLQEDLDALRKEYDSIKNNGDDLAALSDLEKQIDELTEEIRKLKSEDGAKEPTPSAVETPTKEPSPSADNSETKEPSPSAEITPTGDPAPSEESTEAGEPAPTNDSVPTKEPASSEDNTDSAPENVVWGFAKMIMRS